MVSKFLNMKKLTLMILFFCGTMSNLWSQLPRTVFGISFDETPEMCEKSLKRKGLKPEADEIMIYSDHTVLYESVEWTDGITVIIFNGKISTIGFSMETKDAQKCYDSFEYLVQYFRDNYSAYYYDSKFEPNNDNTGAQAHLTLVDRNNRIAIELGLNHNTAGGLSRLQLTYKNLDLPQL